MFKISLFIILIFILGVSPATPGQQPESPSTPGQPRVSRPAVKASFADTIKRFVLGAGATVDTTRTTTDRVVSNYPDPKGGKTTIVIVNDRRRSQIGFYIYNFGNLKKVSNRSEIYRYLLQSNDAITTGGFFVDNEDDIGYKDIVNNQPVITQLEFQTTYFTMAAVARERRPEIRRLIEKASAGEEKPPDPKGAAKEPGAVVPQNQ